MKLEWVIFRMKHTFLLNQTATLLLRKSNKQL